MNTWLPQASYPCGNFSGTSCSKLSSSKGSIGPAFAVRIHTENQNQAGFCPFALREVSVLAEPSRYPCGNFSDTSCLKPLKSKGSIGPAFAVCIHTENQNQASFCPFALGEVSVPTELALGHLRYALTDVPPQSNSPPDAVFNAWSNKCKHSSLRLQMCENNNHASRFIE